MSAKRITYKFFGLLFFSFLLMGIFFIPQIVSATSVCCIYATQSPLTCSFIHSTGKAAQMACSFNAQGVKCEGGSVLLPGSGCLTEGDSQWELDNVLGIFGVKYFGSDLQSGQGAFCPEMPAVDFGSGKKPIYKTEIKGNMAKGICEELTDDKISWVADKSVFDKEWEKIAPTMVSSKVTVSCHARINILETSDGKMCKEEKDWQAKCKQLCEVDDKCVYNNGKCEIPAASASASASVKVPVDVSGLNKLGTTDVKILIGRAIKTGMGIIGSIALAMFIYGGVLWMTASGNSEREKKARDVMVWAALGTIVILASYALVEFVFGAFR